MVKSYIKLLVSMLIWGSLAVFVKQISFTSEQIVLCRVILGLTFLLLVFLLKRKKLTKDALKKYGIRLLITGVVMGFNWVALFESYKYVDVSIATLCYYAAPVIVCICSAIFFREKLTVIKIISIAAAVIGMFVITGATMGGSDPVKGVICGLVSAALYASVTLSNKSVKGLSGLEITIVQLVGAGIVMLPYVLITQGVPVPQNGWKDILFVIILGIAHTGIALYLYFSAIQELPAQTVALCSYVDPVSALVFAAIFFSDVPTLPKVLGAVLIIGGAAFPTVSEMIRSEKKETA